MEKITLESDVRPQLSKGAIRKLRDSGKIPAIFYGDKENICLTVDAGKFGALLSKEGHNAIINLNLSDKTSKTVLIKALQKDVISRKIIHIDFYQVSMIKKIEVSVAVVIFGEAPGVKDGGVLAHIVREIKVKCLPADIPEKITVDVSNLQIGSSLYVKDISIPQGVEVLSQPDQIVVNIVSPTILEEIVPGVSAEAGAEPEVIGKGKKDEEGEEGGEATASAGAKKEAAAPGKEAKKESTSAKKEEKK
jgi:large subunit ribosomal protein L25